MSNFNDKLQTLLKTDARFLDQEWDLLRNEVIDKAFKIDEKLIELLISDNEVKSKFFCEIKGHWVFNINTFVDFIQDKNFLNDSYTKYKNKIWLNIGWRFLNERKEVALVRPYKDCILEWWQSKEDQKRKEIFFNEILAQDEIDMLLDPKVLTNWKKYNKDWEKKVDWFTRDENGTIKDNLIIKGNNLLALHTLKKEFAGKVKLIYIDPPYNTWNDSFNYNDSFNHSGWLTFMKNRLQVARELLRNDWVVFVQCDDNEQAYLKVLMDEIFGRENFVINIVWRRTDNQSNIWKIARVKEYIIIFAKKQDSYNFSKLPLSEKAKNEYRYSDEKGNFRRNILLDKVKWRFKYEVRTPEWWKLSWPWMIKEEVFRELEKNRQLYWAWWENWQPYWKIYLDEKMNDGQIPSDFWWIEFWSNQQWAKDMQEIFGERRFSFPKPEKLIQNIIKMSTEKWDIVLDYHIWSWTTCAVAHKMERQYIWIEQMDYIENISIERLKKVINGDQAWISKSVNRQWWWEFIYCELKKYNQDFIDQIEVAKDIKELLRIWEDMKTKSFLNYNVDIVKQDKAIEEFKQLSLDQQKKALVELLDKNQLYVNLSEINDKDFEVSEEDKKLNKMFYEL